MPRANIDLSWLAGLLTQTPTAANSVNPDYQSSENIPYTDPVTGQTSGVLPNNTPFNAPSNWQRLVHPEQSAAIDSFNTGSYTKPLGAQQDQTAELARRAAIVSRRPSYLQTPGMTPTEAAASGQGGLNQNISEVLGENANDIYALNGGAKMNATAYRNSALAEIARNEATARMFGTGNEMGNPELQAGEANSAAKLGTAHNLGTLGVLNSRFGRELAENTLAEQEAKDNYQLWPKRFQLANTTLDTQNPIATEAKEELPFTTDTMRANAIRADAEAKRMPIPPRYTDMIDTGTGGITLSKDPLGANPFALQFAGINDITSMNGKPQSFKGADGKTYTLPGNSLITGKSEYPLGAPVARPSVGGASIGGGSNNVTSEVPHNVGGLMNHPIPPQSSSTTLTPSITSSIPLTSTGSQLTVPSEGTALHQRINDAWDKLNSGQPLTEAERQHLLQLISASK